MKNFKLEIPRWSLAKASQWLEQAVKMEHSQQDGIIEKKLKICFNIFHQLSTSADTRNDMLHE